MASCAKCGKKTALFADECEVCKYKSSVHATENAKRMELEKARAAADEERLERARVQQLRDGIIRRMAKGQKCYLYESLHVSVDSVIQGERSTPHFDIKRIQAAGLDGWEIIGVVPQTSGVALENVSIGSTMGVTWGAGMGGNVIGVHILLRKEVFLSELQSDGSDELGGYLQKNFS